MRRHLKNLGSVLRWPFSYRHSNPFPPRPVVLVKNPLLRNQPTAINELGFLPQLKRPLPINPDRIRSIGIPLRIKRRSLLKRLALFDGAGN